jgi:hypothetical protein
MFKKISIGFLFGILVISIWVLGSATQAAAETWNYKYFNHVKNTATYPIGDAEGHFVNLTMREGVTIYDNGESAWANIIAYVDMTKGAGLVDMYVTLTFQDKSVIIYRTKHTLEAATAAAPSGGRWTGEIIKGTGRFQGIKGTVTTWGKILPPEKGELGGKAFGEGTMNYTLPPK